MTHQMDLRELARARNDAPPFAFDEFERRQAAARYRRRAGMWSAATSVAALGLVVLLAVMTQQPDPAALLVGAAPAGTLSAGTAMPMQPAVVDLGQFVMTSDLEDHIALLDAQISAARAYAAPPEQLRQLEYTRNQLNDSLQRVSYAQTLLKF